MSINLARYQKGKSHSWGIVQNDWVYPVAGTYPNLADFLDNVLSKARSMAKKRKAVKAPKGLARKIPIQKINFLSPVTSPCNILCQGKNYAAHRLGTGADPRKPDFNLLFAKSSSSLSGAIGMVIRPPGVQLLDYELELGLVVQRDITHPIELGALNLSQYLAGIVMANDISARDIQIPQEQWFKGKSFRTFCPVGPWIVLMDKDDWTKLDQLEMTLSVNGEVRQQTHTSKMIFKPEETLSELSHIVDLKKGDLVLTGTPGGVALHAPGLLVQKLTGLLLSQRRRMQLFVKKQMLSKKYLQNGDLIESTIRSSDGTLDLGTQKLVIEDG